jgi:hypothetical protein
MPSVTNSTEKKCERRKLTVIQVVKKNRLSIVALISSEQRFCLIMTWENMTLPLEMYLLFDFNSRRTSHAEDYHTYQKDSTQRMGSGKKLGATKVETYHSWEASANSNLTVPSTLQP